MIVECPGCGIPKESLYAAGQHLWKSQDGDHDADSLDAALVAVVTHNDVVDSVDPVDDDGGQQESDDAGVDDLEDSPELFDGDTPEQPPSNSPEQSAETDGGRQAPPMPDVDEQEDAGDVDTDDLPDRYVPVEDYVERKGRRDDVDADALADHLEDYDVVDVESYTGDSIQAYTLDEVIDDG